MAKVHAQTLLAASNLYIYTFKYDTYSTTVNVKFPVMLLNTETAG